MCNNTMDMVETTNGRNPPGGEESQYTGKRPMNAFLLFCKRHRALVKERYPTLENRNITKILGEWWHSISDEEKATFNNLASEIKEHVMREQPNFKWRKQTGSNANNSQSSVPAKHISSISRDSSNGCQPSQCQSSPVDTPIDEHSPLHPGSGSSSPEPSPPSNGTHSAPKHFKKRFLAAAAEQQAKLYSEDSVSGSVSPDAEHACKALLQLAGVRDASPTGSPSGSRSGTSSPPSDSGGRASANKTDEFRTLRDAVWSRVAKTLLKQEEEKGNQSHGDSEDAPLNLSSQCTIRGQQIIEHIIENILDKPLSPDSDNEVNGGSFNNNSARSGNDGLSSSSETAEEIKERIYKGLKQDFQKRTPGSKDDKKNMSALWNLLPHNNITNPTSQKTALGSTHPSMPAVQPEPLGGISLAKGGTLPVNTVTTNTTTDPATTSTTTSGLDIKSLLAQSPVPRSSRKSPPPPVSVTLITTDSLASGEPVSRPLNLSTTPPQTPSVSVTPMNVEGPPKKRAHEDDDEDLRRSSRACKGKRYQELKDEGHLGRKGRKTHRSGDDHATGDEHGVFVPLATRREQGRCQNSDGVVPKGSSSIQTHAIVANSTQHTQGPSPGGQSLDFMAKLNAIPALSLEVYQQRVKDKCSGGPISNGNHHQLKRGGSTAQGSDLAPKRRGKRSVASKEDGVGVTS